MPLSKPTIEAFYQNYQWKNIWKNLVSVFVLPKEREVIYKFLHEVLPTRKRLKEMKKVPSSSCMYCGQEESNIHLVYCCPVTNGIIIWLGNLLRKYCSIDNINYMKILFLDLPKLGKKEKNICLFLVTTYIVCIWNLKDNRSSLPIVIKHIKGKIIQKNRYLRYAIGDKYDNMVTQPFSSLKWDDL